VPNANREVRETDDAPLPRPSGDLVPPLRAIRTGSPQVVLVLDRIRRKLSGADEIEEFYWFAREYPRAYRFHADGAEFRLKSIHELMSQLLVDIVRRIPPDSAAFENGISDIRVERVYWDFESFLNEVSVALDLLARVVGPAFRQQSPPSFNKLCKWTAENDVLLDVFRSAQQRWVKRMKNYRDCFVHYTPVDTLLMVSLHYYARTGWELRAKLPTNPNAREILNFRFSRRTELIRYAIATYAHLMALDRSVARVLWSKFREGAFPQRKDNLFAVGRRELPHAE